MHNIVILGAGFGGLRGALRLSKKLKRKSEYKIILVDQNSYQTYTPSLYEVATAYRGRALRTDATELDFEENLANSSCFSLSTVLARHKNIQFLKDKISNILLDAKTIEFVSGNAVSYEYCIVALGAQNAFYGIKGADTCCHTLKTLPEALGIRHKVESAFSKAINENKQVNLITIGAGLSGFEVVAEMAKHVAHLCSAHNNFDRNKVNIKLLEAESEILKGVPARMRSLARKRLKQLGVEVLLNTKVNRIEEDKIILNDNTQILADVSIWSGGVAGLDLFKKIGALPLEEYNGRILVDNKLQVVGQRGIFAIGDSSYFFDQASSRSVPATAWAAEQQADVVVENIQRLIHGDSMMDYEMRFPGFVSSAGGKYAIASLYGITFSGYKAWVVKRLIDLKYILSIYPFFNGLGVWFKELDLWTRND